MRTDAQGNGHDSDVIERSTREIVCRAVLELAPDPDSTIGADHLLVGDLGYDSLRLVELSFVLEELFDLEISAADMPPIGSVAELQDYVIQMIGIGLAQLPDRDVVDNLLTGSDAGPNERSVSGA